jgi:hypothetical protein
LNALQAILDARATAVIRYGPAQEERHIAELMADTSNAAMHAARISIVPFNGRLSVCFPRNYETGQSGSCDE